MWVASTVRGRARECIAQASLCEPRIEGAMSTMKRYFGIGGLAVALVLSLVAISSAEVSDSWITMKTKVALMTTSDLHTSGLNIDTKDGAVTLQGKVESDGEKAKAESVVRTIDGVKGVKNLLQVVPKSMTSTVDARDEDIKKQSRTPSAPTR